MNKEEVLRLNVIPDGKEAWLSYDHYQELKEIFESVKLPSNDKTIMDRQYFQLYDFLTNKAKLQIPMNESAIHFNAFALIRRGYKTEEITSEEYTQLLQLVDEADQAVLEDMELYEFGGHRNLYNFLTKKMGLSVKKGRGPVWHRAKVLVDKYEITHQPRVPANNPNVASRKAQNDGNR
jgi:hypothetical protein